MLPFKKILFPVDFSDQSKGAARYVEAFTGRFDASLTLLNATDPQYNSLMPETPTQRKRRIESFLAKEFEYFHVERVLVDGDPAVQIVNLAAAEKFDLIMMPTHGLGGFRRFLIGSVTAKVLHDADCPVWTGVHLEEAPPLEEIVFQHFLCAVNLEPYSEKVIQSALELANEYRAKLTLVHVQRIADSNDDDSRQRIESLLGPAGPNTTVRVESGEIANAVAVVAAETAADLLVIGRNPAPGVFGRLRSDAYSIIRQSPCPVISV